MHYILRSARAMYPSIMLKTLIEEKSWVYGARFDAPVPPLEFVVEKNEPFSWCDYFFPGGVEIPLFSALLREALVKGGVDSVDYYEASVKHGPTGEKRKYWAANVIGKIKGMDRVQSKYTPFRHNANLAQDIDKLVLDEGALQGIRICRLAEYRNLIIIDEPVKVLIEQNKMAGVICLAPEQWDGFAT